MNLAVCIPTYERAEVINELCDEVLEIYQKNHIDLYLYDSSRTDHTYDVIRKYSDQYNNLYYVRIPSQIESNEKIYNIFKGTGLAKKYEYIWMCGDSLRFYEGAINKLQQYLIDKPDIVVMDIMNSEHLGLKRYTDKNEFFDDCAWYLTLYGAAVINADTMLDKVNWDEMIYKYLSEETFNYSQIGLYFEQINKLKDFEGIHIALQYNEGHMTKMYKRNGWYRDCIRIMCKGWINTVNILPDTYTNKKETILKLGRYSGTFTKLQFYKMRNDNIFNSKVYFEYWDRWNKITEISFIWLFLMAIIPIGQTHYLLFPQNEYCEVKKYFNAIRDFCQKHEHTYVYGAGKYGGFIASVMNGLNIDFEGFAVSADEEKYAEQVSQKTVNFSEVCEQENTGIIIGVGNKYRNEILEITKDKLDSRDIFDKNLNFEKYF